MRVLVLSGGGGLGAYQAGALYHILGEKGISYDGVVGTSVGSINGVEVCMHPAGQEVAAAESLRQQWLDLETSDVVTPHAWSPISLLWNPSTHSVDPLRALLTRRIDMERLRASGKKYAAVSVDIVTGEVLIGTEQATKEALVDHIMSSSMSPIIHPGIRGDGRVRYDGGLVDVTPASQAIAMGATEIDVILTQPVNLGDWDPTQPDRLWNTAPRIFEIMFRALVESDLREIELYNALAASGQRPDKRQVKVRILRPIDPLPMDAAKFDPDEIRLVMDMGYEEAQKVSWDA